MSPSGPPYYWITGQENIYLHIRFRAGTGWQPGVSYGSMYINVEHRANGAFVENLTPNFSVVDGKINSSNPWQSLGMTYLTFGMMKDHRSWKGDGIVYSGTERVGTATVVNAEATWSKPAPPGLEGTAPNYFMNIDVVVNLDEQDCDDCNGCQGNEQVGLGSVDFAFNLGKDANGKSGKLVCKSDLVSPYLASTSSLVALVAPGFEVIRSTNGTAASTAGMLRQILSPSELTDLLTIDANKYEVRFYETSVVGAKVNGLYTLNSGATPLRKYVVENPGPAGTSNRLKISKVTSGTNPDYFYEYEYTEATDTWKLTQPQGTSESLVTTYNIGATQKTETRSIKSGAGTDIKVEKEVYEQDASGIWRKVQHVLDPNGANLTTTYEYWNNINAKESFAKPKLTQSHDGSWEYLEYGSNGQVSKRVRPFGSTLATDPDSVQDVTTSTFTTLTGGWIRETQIHTITGNEVARTYFDRLYSSGTVPVLSKENEIRAISPGAAADNSANLTTKRCYFTTGTYRGELNWEINPDGTGTLVSYTTLTGGSTEKKTLVGQLDSTTAPTSLNNGTETVEVFSPAHQLTSKVVKNWVSGSAGVTIESAVGSNPDSLGRYQRIDYADGTFELFEYGCCGLESHTDRFGIETTYMRDYAQRPLLETRSGVSRTYTYDAAGNLKTIHHGPSGGALTLIETHNYNLAGQETWSKDALNQQTGFAQSFDSGTGLLTRTTTYPDSSTRIEKYARDGQVVEVAGTAARPLKHECGVAQEGGVYRRYCKDILIGEGGAETEWTKTYKDALVRDYKTLYADNATTTKTFDAQGRLSKQVDPDGVITLFGYNNLGELEIIAVDANANNQIDLAGSDRIRKTTVSYGTAHSHPVRVTTVHEWAENGVDSTVEIQKTEQSLDSLDQWTSAFGLTTHSATSQPAAGAWTTTVTRADGSQEVETYADGRLQSQERKDSTSARIGKLSFGYDSLGRRASVTDIRNGPTLYAFNALDQIVSVTSPAPAPGQWKQTTTFDFDSMGRVSAEHLPDTSVTEHEYWPTGALKRSHGSQTYDVSYTYDPQGRMRTMTTSSGLTTWNYSATRGLLSSKTDAANQSVAYSYTSAGRLQTRTWARGVITTYSYNSLGVLTGIDYSDSTPDVAYSVYDRRGRNTTVTDAAGSTATTFNAAGQALTETVTGGVLDGAVIGRGYDSLLRQNTLTLTQNSTTLQTVGYSYDNASRLAGVSDSASVNAAYAYHADSNLIRQTSFSQGSTAIMSIRRDYDLLNRLTAIAAYKASDHRLLTRFAYQYNLLNQRMRATTTDFSAWNYQYDGLGQVTGGTRVGTDGTPLLGHSFGYSFDGIGNRTSTTTNGRTADYDTNNLNQITEREVPGAFDILGKANPDATVTVNSQSTTRDAQGRFYKELTADNSSAPVWQSFTIDAVLDSNSSQETGDLYLAKTPELPQYDVDGNLTADGRWNITWDGENRATVFESISTVPAAAKKKVECKYDSRGRRIEKKSYIWNTGASGYDLISTIRFVYDGWNLIAELDGSGNLIRSYRWGLDLSGSMQGAGGVGGLLSVTVESSSKTYLPSYDGNGNIIAYLDTADSSIVASFEFGPFGELLKAIGSAVNDCLFRFSTKYCDYETGFYYYGYRYYDSALDVWLSRDPLEEKGGVNLYRFCGGDCINRVDFLGLDFTYKSVWQAPDITYAKYRLWAYTGDAHDVPSLALPKVDKVNTEDVIEETADRLCATVVRAKQLNVDVLTILPDDSNHNIKFTESGVAAAVQHEVRRATVYRLAYFAFIAPIESVGAEVVKCGTLKKDQPGEAKKLLLERLEKNRAKAIAKYKEYIEREQGMIGAERKLYNSNGRLIDSIIPYKIFPPDQQVPVWELCPVTDK